ncbi:MAG TPA: cytochrome P450 [Kofleriaceae bacterium]|nr:cytochrome P450 [Kofleriaceae bacterium]
MSLPPGPRAPSVVQLVEFTPRPLEWLEACAARYGDPFTVRFPALGTYVLAAAPGLIKEIFTGDPEVLKAGKANELLRPILGNHSVILLDGAPHLRQRRLLSPPLRGERMHAYAELIAAITATELARMPVGRACSLYEHLQAITLDVILRAVFGLDDGPHLRELRGLLVAMLEPPPAILAFLPPRWLDLPLSPYRTFLRRRDAVDAALHRIIRARTAAPDRERTDILSLLLAARDDQGVAMTEDELRDELMTMLIAGHETTATALSWAFACVLDRPDVEARLQDELSGARTAGGALDLAAVPALDYLDAVVKETLRVRPILPDVARYLERPLRFAGYDLPASVNVAPCIHLAHRRAEAFPEPARFRPERWLGAKVDPYTWLPFGGGIRRCLGMAFALFEMKIVLAVVLSRARLRLATPGPVRVVRRTISLAPAGGTRVVLDRRA